MPGIPFLLCARTFGTQAKEIRLPFVQLRESPLPGGKISLVGDQIRPGGGRSKPPPEGTRDKEQGAYVSPGQSGTLLASATSTIGLTVTPTPQGHVGLATRSSSPVMERDWGGTSPRGTFLRLLEISSLVFVQVWQRY